ncbi:MAG TPA: addiction module protein [Myxococcaceae bacterium]|nr:addiction module protein [Myxococcaceae bacterium]
MATKDDLLSDVLRLPPEERAEVAHKLLLSLDESEDADAEAAWSQELERRAREVLDGSVKTVPWEQVEARITARLGQRR